MDLQDCGRQDWAVEILDLQLYRPRTFPAPTPARFASCRVACVGGEKLD
jgi:hypothetical protein